jgi:fumarate reductase subunit C
MAGPAHPHAMQPPQPGRTRTAPPSLPDQFPYSGRYRAYLLFGATGLLYLLVGFVVLRAVWALGNGAAAWEQQRLDFASPLSILYHAITLAGVCFVAVRFFRLFPKSQPPRIGPLKPPPRPLIHAGLYAAWGAVTLLFALILGGAIF